MGSILRQRKKKFLGAEIVKELDTFPKKLTDEHIDRSGIGGAVTLFALTIMTWIVASELKSYFDSSINLKFSPDTNFNEKLKLNVDFTVAMPCFSIGADILDSTEQNLFMFGQLEEEDTWFELSPEQEEAFNDMRQLNTYLREEFHAVHKFLWNQKPVWKPGQSLTGLPKRTSIPTEPTNACRIYGSLIINKVSGNLHVTGGKALHLPQGHVHISAFTPHSSHNFSHRINHFSFGDASSGIVHPLDNDVKITHDSSTLFQYFVEVVPTDVETLLTNVQAYQLSVKDHERVIDHDKGSHGVPGIFFKYDMSALRVKVTQDREPLPSFFLRLTSIAAGVYVIAGIFRDILVFFHKKSHPQGRLSSKVQNISIIDVDVKK